MSGERQLDVLVVGDLFIELVMSGFPSWPRPGEEAFSERFCREVGGGAAITACGLAKLGARVGIFGSVGEEDGQWVLNKLTALGIATSTIHLDDREPTALTVSVSGPSDRAYLTYMGANRRLSELLGKAASAGELSRARHIHLACAPDPATVGDLFRTLAEQGCSLSADIGWHPEWLADPRCRQALRAVDMFFPNEREASHMTGGTDPEKMLEFLRDEGFRKVALKLGADGAALLWDGKIIFQKASPVESVDTTGAGDCFDAGFLDAWLRGDAPQNCLRAGTVCGALSTRVLGGISGFPTKAELESTI
ncbi:MAG: carbohydrate kinase family protein [Acidobacteriota bacterium]|nr:carbohydrate kinase family protein [Acidobacteriota bacterium]